MFTPALTALALVLTAAHYAPLALQAVPGVQDSGLQAENIEQTEPVAETEPEALPELPEPVELGDSSPKRSDPVSIEVVRDEVEPSTNTAPVTTAPVATPEDTVTPETDNVPTPVQPAGLTAAEQADILNRVSEALTAARTAKGKFLQINADGSISTGTFALRRPGRVRFDYDDPTPILIVSDGATVAMEDRDLETIDRIPLASTPLGLLLDDNLDFSKDVDVINVTRNADRVSVTVQDATGEVEGDLTMVFADQTYDLLGWLTLDANFQTTVVELSEVEQNTRLNPRLFRLEEDEEDER
ncbi:MAG: outer-membrane lipoprotein carrier protein LolA [Henriciella sp.]|nr:outer-membrane lipoprotein carrier protein LolA [Henriciella sp.]